MARTRPVALVLAALALSVGLAACGGDSGGLPVEGTQWTVATIAGNPPVAVTTATLQLTDGQASGSAGCNTYTGAYTLDGSSLTFGPLASTQMACEQAVMDQEAVYLTALQGASTYAVDGDTLTITGSGVELTYSGSND